MISGRQFHETLPDDYDSDDDGDNVRPLEIYTEYYKGKIVAGGFETTSADGYPVSRLWKTEAPMPKHTAIPHGSTL